MADRIKLRRGPKNKMDLKVYELAYATDSTEKRLYFNDGSMVPIPNEKDIIDIKTELTEATNVTNKNKQDVSELKESVDGIIKTGVAKLVQYSYDIELSENTQKVNIPYEKYSSVTDTLKVYVNGLAIQNDQYTITDPVENDGIVTNGYIVLKAERPAGTIVRMEVWKNVLSGEEGEVSGNIIAQNSLPLNRIIGIGDIGIYTAICVYTDSVYTLTLKNSPATLGDEFTVRFKVPNNYVDNSAIVIKDKSYEIINGNFEDGEIVSVNIDNVNNKAFFRKAGVGGGDIETLPQQVESFNAFSGDGEIALSWNNNNTDYLEGYYIVYKEGSYPAKINDGTKIEVSKDLNTIVIKNLNNDTNYYFRIYPYNSKLQIQSEYKVVNSTPMYGKSINMMSLGCKFIDSTKNKWILISKNDTNLILIEELFSSKTKSMKYGENTDGSVNYENSLIDNYLSKGEYYDSLPIEIKKYLVDYNLKDENINRKVFIISHEEIRQCDTNGVSIYYFVGSSSQKHYWWLRT